MFPPGAGATHLQAYPSPRDVQNIITSSAPHLIFLDVSSDRDQALDLLSELNRLGSSVHVIALMSGNDPDFILRCLRAGASEFLIEPFTSEQVEGAFSRLARLQTSGDASGKDTAKIFAVMPTKGACGATTVATNFAFQWKRMGAKRVLLADLDPLAGTLSFLLKVKSTFSFLDAMIRAQELDEDLWNAMITSVNGIDVLLAPEMMMDNAQELRDPSPVLDYARHHYDVVVVDAGGVYGDWNLNLARAANEVLLVTTNELPALQATQRALSYLDTNRIGRWKIRLIINRYLQDVGLNRDVIGTALHFDVFETLPSDYEAIQKALLDGKPIPTSTTFGKGVVKLVERLGGKSESAKKSSGLGSLLGLFSKTSKK
ncbi:MAG: AAA family ATPase [Bryobacteraceae bacterium]